MLLVSLTPSSGRIWRGCCPLKPLGYPLEDRCGRYKFPQHRDSGALHLIAMFFFGRQRSTLLSSLLEHWGQMKSQFLLPDLAECQFPDALLEFLEAMHLCQLPFPQSSFGSPLHDVAKTRVVGRRRSIGSIY
eukprot:Blabericola_migrator_1__5856@NODE_2967_length_2155_cov_4_952107_g1857_i0_p1_GENE_NODE_2967_length_2155_cov_4_952107_g1857_i0NODE_2967_length_2155_cov_4_952107_g1857_i0_p1_ORF_typecomplete_len132_score13_51_NODE_2967_length_2155_cov_4_952107_g1857_i081476